MKPVIASLVLTAVVLAGCQKTEEAPATTAGRGPFGAGQSKGRYVLSGLYDPGRLWREIVRPADPNATSNGAAATLRDDDKIIVVVDTTSGEVRQCGNLSGYCTRISPWGRARPQEEPVALSKHQEQLDAEDAAERAAADAANAQALDRAIKGNKRKSAT